MTTKFYRDTILYISQNGCKSLQINGEPFNCFKCSLSCYHLYHNCTLSGSFDNDSSILSAKKEFIRLRHEFIDDLLHSP